MPIQHEVRGFPHLLALAFSMRLSRPLSYVAGLNSTRSQTGLGLTAS